MRKHYLVHAEENNSTTPSHSQTSEYQIHQNVYHARNLHSATSARLPSPFSQQLPYTKLSDYHFLPPGRKRPRPRPDKSSILLPALPTLILLSPPPHIRRRQHALGRGPRPLGADVRGGHVLAVGEAAFSRHQRTCIAPATRRTCMETTGKRKNHTPLFHKFPSLTQRLSTHFASGNLPSSSGRKSRGPEHVRPSRMPAYPAG